MRYLKAYGFDEIAINVHYLADAIVAALGDGSRFGVKLSLLARAGAARQRRCGKEDRSVFRRRDVRRDRLRRADRLRLDRLLDFHRERDAMATIGSSSARKSISTGSSSSTTAAKSSSSRRSRRSGNERSKLVNTGIYVFSPAIFEHIPRGEFYDFGKQVFPSLQAADERFYGFDARGAYWADIGTPREYRRASYDVVRGVVRIPHAEPNGVDPSARSCDGARIEGPVRIGAGVCVGDGRSIVGPSVLDDDVTHRSGRAAETYDPLARRDRRRGRGAARHDRRQRLRRRRRESVLNDSLVARWLIVGILKMCLARCSAPWHSSSLSLAADGRRQRFTRRGTSQIGDSRARVSARDPRWRHRSTGELPRAAGIHQRLYDVVPAVPQRVAGDPAAGKAVSRPHRLPLRRRTRVGELREDLRQTVRRSTPVGRRSRVSSQRHSTCRRSPGEHLHRSAWRRAVYLSRNYSERRAAGTSSHERPCC